MRDHSDHSEHDERLPDLPASDASSNDAAVKGGLNPQPLPPKVLLGNPGYVPPSPIIPPSPIRQF